MRTFILAATLLTCLTTEALAAVYDYHPLSGLSLGRGYDPRKPTDVKAQSCVEYSGEENISAGIGSEGSGLTVTVLNSRTELLRSLGTSTTFDAHFGFAGIGGSITGSFSRISETAFTSDSVTWAARADITLGQFAAKGMRLSPIGEAMMELPAEDREAIAVSTCGIETVSMVTRGAVAAVYYHVTNLDSSTKQELQRKLGVAVSSPLASGEATTSYREAVRTASQRGILRVEMYTQGGPGQAFLETTLRDVSNLEAIQQALATYLRGVTAKNAKAMRWHSSSNDQFGLPTKEAAFSHRDNVLEQLNEVYLGVMAVNKRIYAFIQPTSDPELDYLAEYVSDRQRKTLTATYSENLMFLKRLYSTALECLGKPDACDVPNWTALPQVEWPEIPEAPTVVFEEVCEINFLGVIGQEVESGTLVGYKYYIGHVSSPAPDLFAGLFAVVGENRFPLTVGSDAEWLSVVRPTCYTYATEVVDSVGAFIHEVPLLHQKQESVAFEVLDKLGRRIPFSPPR